MATTDNFIAAIEIGSSKITGISLKASLIFFISHNVIACPVGLFGLFKIRKKVKR